MSYVSVKRPNDKWGIWSVGHVTNTYDMGHGTSQHLTSKRPSFLSNRFASRVHYAILRTSRVPRMRTSSFQKLIRLLPIALVMLGSWFFPSPALADSTSLSFRTIFGDFDGDHRLDQAHLVSNGSKKQISLHFQQAPSKTLSFDAGVTDPGSLVSGDINQDGDADLVWLSHTSSIKIVFWVGDGHGNFTVISDPALQSQLSREFFHSDISWQPSDRASDDDLDGLLSDDGIDTLQTTLNWIPYLVSTRRGPGRQSVATVSSPFLSVLHKRGPPSLAHR